MSSTPKSLDDSLGGQNDDSVKVGSLSTIFKKPKPLLRNRRKMLNASNLNASSSIESSAPLQQPELNAKNVSATNSSNILNNGPNFSETSDSASREVSWHKKRRERSATGGKSLLVSFSEPADESYDSVTLPNKAGYLRKLRKNVKPAQDTTFSTEVPVLDENSLVPYYKVNRLFSSKAKTADNFCSLAGISLSSSGSWNSSPTVRPIRRCSTPLQGISQDRMSNEANISAIPRALRFSDQDSKVIAVDLPATRNGTKAESSRPKEDVNFIRSISDSNNSSFSASFVSKVFRSNETITERYESISLAVKNRRPPRQTDPDLCRKSTFPKFAPFCNKRFYRYINFKMESKFGIETKSQAVEVSQKVHRLVEKIASLESNYRKLVRKLRKLLFRRNIVRNCHDFYVFSMKFLPREVLTKIVPIIQPFGLPLLVDFNSEKVFAPIGPE